MWSWLPCIKFFRLLPIALMIKSKVPNMTLHFVIKAPSLTTLHPYSLFHPHPQILAHVVFVLVIHYCFNFLYVPGSLLPLGTECDIFFEYDIFSSYNTHPHLILLRLNSPCRSPFPWKSLPVSPSLRWCLDCMLQSSIYCLYQKAFKLPAYLSTSSLTKFNDISSHVCLIWDCIPSPGTQ